MSTTSPNFNLILATSADAVNVDIHVAGNFSTLDSLLSVVHTGVGQLKPGLTMSSPSITSPTLVGIMTGGTVIATTGRFNTITATGGALTVNSLNIGTYSLPSTIGAANQLYTVITGNAVWAAAAPGTGASVALDNLSLVAINTNLNALTASVVTVTTLKANTVTATGGLLSGFTSVSATTGTFGANLTVIGTAQLGAVNATGGMITAGGFAIGTYAYPATAGTVAQSMRMSNGNLIFGTMASELTVVAGSGTTQNGGVITIASTSKTLTINSFAYVHAAGGLRASGVANSNGNAVVTLLAGTTTLQSLRVFCMPPAATLGSTPFSLMGIMSATTGVIDFLLTMTAGGSSPDIIATNSNLVVLEFVGT